MLGALIDSSIRDSATADEPAHIVAATHTLRRSTTVQSRTPATHKGSLGACVTGMSLKFPYEYFNTNPFSQYESGHTFLFRLGNNADRILFRARLPIVLITISLGVLVFLWSKEINGFAAGIFFVALFAFDPNIIAHGHLVTHDVGISMAVALNLYFLWRFLRKPSTPSLLLSGLTLGIALVTKFSRSPALRYLHGLVRLFDDTRP